MIDVATAKESEDDPLYVWYYEGKNGWWQYDERTTKELEEAFMKKHKQCTVLIAGNVYNIDFTIYHQYRLNDASKYRRVKRDFYDRPKKGIAGIKQKLNTADTDSLVSNLSRLDLVEVHL